MQQLTVKGLFFSLSPWGTRKLKSSFMRLIFALPQSGEMEVKMKDNQKKEPGKFSLPRIWLYSFASSGLNIVAITVSTWVLYFYAPPASSGRTQYISATLVGIILTVTALVAAVANPLIGHLSDNLRSRLGRRRPFLIFATPVMALSVILLWTPPKNSSSALIYFLVVATVYALSYNFVGVPYDSTLPDMASDSKDRVNVSYWKSLFGMLGVLIGALVAAPLFSKSGPLSMGIVVAAVGSVTIWLSVFGIRETKKTDTKPLSLLSGIKFTFTNKQFIYLFASTLFIHVSYQMLLANLPYFVTVVIGKSETFVSVFQGVLILIMCAFGPLWGIANKKFKQRNLLTASMLGLAVVCAIGFFVGTIAGIPAAVQGIIFMVLIAAPLGGFLIVAFAIMGNVVDYDEMLTGRRREAAYYGTFAFANGLGVALGSLILPILFNAFGNSKNNSLGVRSAFLIMAAFSAAALIIFRKYKLGDTLAETKENLKLK